MIVNIKSNPALAAFLRRAFPGYRKHKAIIRATNHLTLSGTHWDGGSRSTYSAVNAQGTSLPLTYSTAPTQFGGVEKEIILTPNILILEAGTFCGKPATVTIHALPETLAALGITQE